MSNINSLRHVALRRWASELKQVTKQIQTLNKRSPYLVANGGDITEKEAMHLLLLREWKPRASQLGVSVPTAKKIVSSLWRDLASAKSENRCNTSKGAVGVRMLVDRAQDLQDYITNIKSTL